MAEDRTSLRGRLIIRTSILTILANLGLVGFKLVVGVMANSLAIVTDAINNLSDGLSSCITILGIRLASHPPDRQHPFGYGRIQYLVSILLSGLVLLAGGFFGVLAVGDILAPRTTHYSVLTVLTVSAAIVTKLLLGWYARRMGRETRSHALHVSGTDAILDAAVSAGTLAGALVTLCTGVVIDGWIGLAVSLVILKAGLEMLLETLNIIVGRRGEGDLAEEIEKALGQMDEILGVYDLVLYHYGPARTIGAVNVAVYDWRTAGELHAISHRARERILDRFDVELTIGFYAENTRSGDLRDLEDQVRARLRRHPYVLSIHGFLVDPGAGDVSFHLVVDDACKEPQRLMEDITLELREAYAPRLFSIRMDRDHSQ